MINKSTFYSHYADIYDLSDTLETEVVNSIIQTLDHADFIYKNPAESTHSLYRGCLSQDRLIQILFADSRSSQLINRIEQGIKELIFRDYPHCRDNAIVNVTLSYTIYGGYFAFMGNQQYNQEQVIAILSQISRYASDLLQQYISPSF